MAQRILVVDDDRKIVRLLRASLEQAGYQVFVAYDGETALHMLRRERPDLVVLDLMLPDRDGWDVTRVMRGDPTLADTPIIMLTARVEHHDRIVGLELGADDYITKPFSPRELVARVRAVLRRVRGGVHQRGSGRAWLRLRSGQARGFNYMTDDKRQMTDDFFMERPWRNETPSSRSSRRDGP